MDVLQTALTACAGLLVSLATAYVTYNITRKQERRKYEREVAAKLVEINSSEPDATRIFAIQHAQGCLVIETEGSAEKTKYFLPSGCRITLGRSLANNIVVQEELFSVTDVTFISLGEFTYLEPLQPTNALTINGRTAQGKRKLSNGDVISKDGARTKITFIQLQVQR